MTQNEEDHPSPIAGLTLREGLDMLDAANRRVKFRGYNSLEVRQLRRLSAEQWARIRAEYRGWIKRTRLFGFWGPVACLLIGGAGFAFLHGWMREIALAIALLSLLAIGRLEGHREGYLDGYSNGFDGGINKALGLTEDDLKFISEASVDMELQERRKAHMP